MSHNHPWPSPEPVRPLFKPSPLPSISRNYTFFNETHLSKELFLRYEQWSEDGFNEARRTGLGGSDAGAVAGVNPYKGALKVYCEKKLLIEPEPENERMRWGHLHELTIAKEYERLTRRKAIVMKPGIMFRHQLDKFMVAHVDAIVYDGTEGNPSTMRPWGLLEIKTADSRAASQWGDTGTDEVPESYLLQCQHYMHVTGLNRCDVAVLIGGNDLRIYHIERNEMLIKYLCEIETRFWIDNVLAEVAPPSEGNDHCKKLLAEMYRKDNGETVEADEEIQKTVERYAQVRRSIKKLEDEKLLFESRIQEHMKNASTLKGDGFVITWKKDKDRKVTDWAAVAVEAGASEEIIEKHTTTKEGSKRFIPKFEE